MTDEAWFSRLLRHLAENGAGLFLQPYSLHGATKHDPRHVPGQNARDIMSPPYNAPMTLCVTLDTTSNCMFQTFTENYVAGTVCSRAV